MLFCEKESQMLEFVIFLANVTCIMRPPPPPQKKRAQG